MGLESVSMAASPICTIMGCRKGWKGFHGSVPHLYDNGAQEGLERLPWQRPPFVRQWGAGRAGKASMAASPICTTIGEKRRYRCTDVQMYRCPNVPMSKCTDVPKPKCTKAQMYRCTKAPFWVVHLPEALRSGNYSTL